MQKIKLFRSLSNIYLLSNLLLVFLLPFNQLAISLLIIINVVLGITYAIRNWQGVNWKEKWPFLFFILFYGIHILSAFRGISDTRFTDLEVKLSFVLFPFVMIIFPKANFNKERWIEKTFIAGILLVYTICIIMAFIHSISINAGWQFNSQLGDHNYFFYSLFSIFTHPSYNTLFTTLAMVFLFKLIATGTFKRKWHYMLIGFILTLNVYMLSSRAGTYAFFAVLYFSVFAYYLWRKKILNSLIYVVLVSVLFVGFQKFNYRVIDFSKQVENQVEIAKTEGVEKADVANVNIRWAYWKIGLELVQPNMITGIGVGNVKTLRNAKFQEYGFEEGLEKGHNFHNQFMETLVGTGVVGLVSLLLLFLVGMYIGVKKRDYVLLSFVIITGINFLFESMLMLAAGVIFFCFFYVLILFQTNVQEKEKAA